MAANDQIHSICGALSMPRTASMTWCSRNSAHGAKRSHWIWFVFPQLRGLGHSPTAVRFGISSLDEARAYLAHPVLGPRLRECARLVSAIDGRSVDEIFGWPDNLKVRSSMTLFARAADGASVVQDGADFRAVLDKFYDGRGRSGHGRAAQRGAMISQPCGSISAVGDDRWRRCARPRDDLARADAEFRQRQRHRGVVDVERHHTAHRHRCGWHRRTACWSACSGDVRAVCNHGVAPAQTDQVLMQPEHVAGRARRLPLGERRIRDARRRRRRTAPL